MSAEYTPGPWTVEVDEASGIGRTHAVYVCDARAWPEGQLARVNVQDGYGEREANARLIAAAPDLLAALVDATEVLNLELSGQYSRTISAARAAITKATVA